MKKIRRPGYLAGYEPFGKTKGVASPAPEPPTPVIQLIPVASASPAPSPTATLTPAPPPAPTPMTLTPAQRADPAFMARIAALQRQVRSRPQTRPVALKPIAPRPAARPTLPQEDDDED